jgi:hypothetical protein
MAQKVDLCIKANDVANDLQLRRLRRKCEFESGAGQKGVEEAGRVLYPPQPGLDHCC